MKIGELAKVTGCTVQTIRFYEKEQLLGPVRRSEGNFRLYDTTVVDQLMFIKRCRNLDLALSEIRQLLDLAHSPGKQCDDVNQLIDNHIQQVEDGIQELTKLRQQLKSLRSSCSRDRTVEQCGILQNLSVSADLQ